ncbi:unnamed protein product [Meganyctiphanes norvegica]|uniref:Uncharacterized protein n=1 Tax=Meganyctiphanes norvegica TaxID=48144 RepID=A0AAV2PXL0_MEGNR
MWLRYLDMEIDDIGTGICNLNLDEYPLSHSEYMKILCIKLDHAVISKIMQIFSSHTPVLTWDTVTKVQIHNILLKEYSNKEEIHVKASKFHNIEDKLTIAEENGDTVLFLRSLYLSKNTHRDIGAELNVNTYNIFIVQDFLGCYDLVVSHMSKPYTAEIPKVSCPTFILF